MDPVPQKQNGRWVQVLLTLATLGLVVLCLIAILTGHGYFQSVLNLLLPMLGNIIEWSLKK